MTHANDNRKKPIPVPEGGFSSNEEQARWLEQTLAMRFNEALRNNGITAEMNFNKLYELILICLDSAYSRGLNAR